MATRRKKKSAGRKRVARVAGTSGTDIRNDRDVRIRRSHPVTYHFEGSTRRGRTITIGTDGGIIIGSR